MKNQSVACGGILLATLLSSFGQQLTDTLPDAAQESVPGTPGVATKRAVINFGDLARQKPNGLSIPKIRNGKDSGPSASGGPTKDGPLRRVVDSPSPASSFLALDAIDVLPPPDTMGAVGPNHLMVMLNHGVRIQDRAGGLISTVSLSNFWAAVGPFNTYTYQNTVVADVFDPKVLYDPYENRWICISLADYGINTSSLVVGVSQSNDPTGNWNLYRIDADSANTAFIDFPRLGFNKDWIGAQGNMFDSGGNFVRSHIYAFNKTNLYAGGAGLFRLFSRSDISTGHLPATTFDPSLSTLYLINRLGVGASSLNSIRVYSISGPVGAEVLTLGPTITAPVSWSDRASGGGDANFAPQLGTSTKINVKASHIESVVYRNGSLWAAHTIFLPAGGSPTRCSIQWWEVSPAGAILQRGLIDDPSGTNFYGFPTLSVNQNNDVLIGYNRYSARQYASANYSFRAGNDPLNLLRADTVLKAGEAPYDIVPFGVTRWGDYSATMVDPVNDLDLWTIQEYASALVPGQDNWSTWWGRISPVRVLAVEIAGADVRIRFTSAPDQTYRVERTGSLIKPMDWEPVSGATNVPGTGTTVEATDANAANQSQRFYRVGVRP